LGHFDQIIALARLGDRQQKLVLQIQIAGVDRGDAGRRRRDRNPDITFDGMLGKGGGMRRAAARRRHHHPGRLGLQMPHQFGKGRGQGSFLAPNGVGRLTYLGRHMRGSRLGHLHLSAPILRLPLLHLSPNEGWLGVEPALCLKRNTRPRR